MGIQHQHLLIDEIHRTNGHPGVKETIHKIAREFYFPKMNYMVREHLKKCRKCITFNPLTRQRITSEKKMVASKPFEIISIDPVPMVRTKNGKEHLLIIVDNFSRFMKAIPIADATSKTVSNTLRKHWINNYMAPNRIRTDNATSFNSKEWESFCQSIGAEHCGAASKHQNSAGMAEPNWKTLKIIMAKEMMGVDEDKWEEFVNKAVNQFNNRRHSGIKMKPLEAAFGGEETDALNPIHATIAKFAKNSQILDTIHKQDNEMTKQKFHDFKVGEKVWYRNTSAVGKIGFPPRNLGPYNIKELKGTDLVILEKTQGGPWLHYLQKVQHVNDIQRHTLKENASLGA